MKRITTLLLVGFITVGGVFADSLSFTTEKIAYEPVKVIQVQPSADIIDIFADEDNDVDEVFADLKEFLNVGADTNKITTDEINYVNYILGNDVDDIRSEIHDELEAALDSNGADEAYMILGNTKLSLSVDF